MKITFVLPPANMSGGIRVISLYAEALSNMGHDVCIFSTPPPRPGKAKQIKSILKGQGRIPWKDTLPSYLDDISVPHIVLNSVKVTDKDVPDADVVVATWWETADWVAAFSPAKGAKAYFMQDYGAPGQEIGRISTTWKLPLYMITLTETLATMIRHYNPAAAVEVIPNAVDTALFNACKRGKQPIPTVGFLYRTSPSKGIDIAIRAIEMARKALPGIKVIAYGHDDPVDAYRLPQGTIFHRLPADSELSGLYASCDVWLFPSRMEGFGLPILEAMACRTPVISTPVGAAPELVTPDRGFIVPTDNAEAMADAILKIARLPEEDWLALSSASHSSVNMYTWDDASKMFENALQKSIKYSALNDRENLHSRISS